MVAPAATFVATTGNVSNNGSVQDRGKSSSSKSRGTECITNKLQHGSPFNNAGSSLSHAPRFPGSNASSRPRTPTPEPTTGGQVTQIAAQPVKKRLLSANTKETIRQFMAANPTMTKSGPLWDELWANVQVIDPEITQKQAKVSRILITTAAGFIEYKTHVPAGILFEL